MCFQAFQNKFFSALWASFGLQIRGEEPLTGSATEKKNFCLSWKLKNETLHSGCEDNRTAFKILLLVIKYFPLVLEIHEYVSRGSVFNTVHNSK